MQLSVIILNYNVRFFLEQCVLSVQKALEGIDGEIIIVDNNSSDDSCAMMKQLFPAIKLIENKENLGFPKGNNMGVAHAKGDYVCILNPDTVVAEDTFSKILQSENWQPNTGIIGCKLIDGNGNFLPESKRGVPTPWVAFTKIFGLYKMFPKLELFNQYYAQHLSENSSGKVDILVGAFMMMKRDLYNEIGGFDENCFMYSDDIDLSYSVIKKGKHNYYFAETSVIITGPDHAPVFWNLIEVGFVIQNDLHGPLLEITGTPVEFIEEQESIRRWVCGEPERQVVDGYILRHDLILNKDAFVEYLVGDFISVVGMRQTDQVPYLILAEANINKVEDSAEGQRKLCRGLGHDLGLAHAMFRLYENGLPSRQSF